MIRGKRVLLRPVERDDLDYLTALANDTEVRSRVVGWDWPLSLSSQEAWFDASHASATTRRFVVENDVGERVGLTGLWDVDWHNRNALTACKLGGRGVEARGRGYGTDAIRALMAFAFYDVGLHRLHSTVLDGNLPSLHAYVDKCNWQVEGSARSHVYRDGGYVDLLHIGALRADFDALSDAAEYRALLKGSGTEGP